MPISNHRREQATAFEGSYHWGASSCLFCSCEADGGKLLPDRLSFAFALGSPLLRYPTLHMDHNGLLRHSLSFTCWLNERRAHRHEHRASPAARKKIELVV
jgi:hypothetical protein